MSKVAGLLAQVKAARISTPEAVARFFKTAPGSYGAHDRFLGVPNPALRKIAKHARGFPLSEVPALLASPFNEVRFLALVLLIDLYQNGDSATQAAVYRLYLQQLAHINNWNLVDASAPQIVGAHLFTRSRTKLFSLSRSPNLWRRRIAIVSTLYFIRQDDLEDTFQLAAQFCQDTEDLIHKASGWMLREAGKRDGMALRAFLKEHAPQMPRTMLRYAIEHLTPTERTRFLRLRP